MPFRRIRNIVHAMALCLSLASVFVSVGCSPYSGAVPSDFADVSRRPVAVINDILEVEGFIAGGGYSERQAEAINTASSSCDDIFTMALTQFDRFRVVVQFNQADRSGARGRA